MRRVIMGFGGSACILVGARRERAETAKKECSQPPAHCLCAAGTGDCVCPHGPGRAPHCLCGCCRTTSSFAAAVVTPCAPLPGPHLLRLHVHAPRPCPFVLCVWWHALPATRPLRPPVATVTRRAAAAVDEREARPSGGGPRLQPSQGSKREPHRHHSPHSARLVGKKSRSLCGMGGRRSGATSEAAQCVQCWAREHATKRLTDARATSIQRTAPEPRARRQRARRASTVGPPQNGVAGTKRTDPNAACTRQQRGGGTRGQTPPPSSPVCTSCCPHNTRVRAPRQGQRQTPAPALAVTGL